MSERMPPAEPAEDERRQWWWQKRPPADRTSFARGVWWAGHLQLFVAAALLLVCLPLFVGGVAATSGEAGPSAALLSRRAGEVQGVMLGLAMAGPFVLSGKMLRASSGWRVYSRTSIGGGPLRRFLALSSTVVGIAILSIVLTAGAFWALLPAIDVIVYLSGG